VQHSTLYWPIARFELDFKYETPYWYQRFKVSDWIATGIVEYIRLCTAALITIMDNYKITGINFSWYKGIKVKKTIFLLNINNFAPEITKLTYPFINLYAIE